MTPRRHGGPQRHGGGAGTRRARGSSTLEMAVGLMTAVIAGLVMADYMNASLKASLKMTEMQLNGAIADNVP